jgi:hypothetical protein
VVTKPFLVLPLVGLAVIARRLVGQPESHLAQLSLSMPPYMGRLLVHHVTVASNEGPQRTTTTDSNLPTSREIVRLAFLSMVGPVALSAIGPIYYGYTDSPYWRIIVWALACTVPFLWWARPAFMNALSTHDLRLPGLILAIVVAVVTAFIIGDTLIYLLARSL